MKNTISKKYIIDYITSNYGAMRHDIYRMYYAIISTAKVYKLNKKDLFHYIIERTSSISGATSYGFDTAYGREIRDRFEHEYYNN
jgi:hypothetical protein